VRILINFVDIKLYFVLKHYIIWLSSIFRIFFVNVFKFRLFIVFILSRLRFEKKVDKEKSIFLEDQDLFGIKRD